MTLNAQQIDRIKAFISKRGFTYPDVQLEIIDHVASRVEEMMTDKPALTLDDAIQFTHAEFGIMGFSVFEDAMISALQRKYFKLFYTNFASYFTWRYLPLMALFVYVFNKVYSAVNNPDWFFAGGFILLIVGLVLNTIIYNARYKKYNKLLTMKMGNTYLIVPGLIFQLWNLLGIQLKLYRYASLQSTGILFGVLVVIIVLLICTVNAVRKDTTKACADLDEKYNLLNA